MIAVSAHSHTYNVFDIPLIMPLLISKSWLKKKMEGKVRYLDYEIIAHMFLAEINRVVQISWNYQLSLLAGSAGNSQLIYLFLHIQVKTIWKFNGKRLRRWGQGRQRTT